MPSRAILLSAAIVLSVVAFFALVIGLGAARLSALRHDEDGGASDAPLTAAGASTRPTTVPSLAPTATSPVSPPESSPGRPSIAAADVPARPNHVSLTANKALVHGKQIKVHNRRKRGEAFIGSWHERDDYAEWSAVVPRAGGYAVELTYTCDEGAGGKFELVVGDVAVAGRSEQTGDDGSMVGLGAVELPAGQTRVLLRPAGRIEGELMKLRRIDLFPLDDGQFALAKKADFRRLPPPGSVITLAAQAAELPEDGPQLEGEGEKNIGNWTDARHVIEWDLNSPGGTFHVDVTYACENERPWRFAVSVAGRQLDGRTAPTGGWDDYETVRLGAVPIPPGPARLAIRGTDRELDGYLMNLRRVELIRADAQPAIANPAPGPSPPAVPGDAERPDDSRATPVAATLAEPVFLPARLAALHGSEIRFEDHDDGDENDRSIGFWRDPEEHVEWLVHLERPARYRVVLSYACAAGHGGEVTLTSASKPLKARIKGEGTWDDPPRTLDLGAIALPAGDTPLLLKPARPMPDGRALMNCRGLLLLPVGE